MFVQHYKSVYRQKNGLTTFTQKKIEPSFY